MINGMKAGLLAIAQHEARGYSNIGLVQVGSHCQALDFEVSRTTALEA